MDGIDSVVISNSCKRLCAAHVHNVIAQFRAPSKHEARDRQTSPTFPRRKMEALAAVKGRGDVDKQMFVPN
jgi:hypothetical protein